MGVRIGAAVVVAASLIVGACSSGAHRPAPAADNEPQVGAEVALVEMADLPAQFEAGGVVRARATATVSSRIMAPILEVRVRPGDRVRRGEALVVLDGRDLQSQATRATASAGAMRQTIEAANADVQSAEAALALARLTHERIASLNAKRSATGQELDEAVAGLRAAEARYAAAQARARESSASLAAADAAAQGAAVTASYSTIVAPFDGTITQRAVDPGSVAAPGMPLLTVEDTSAFRLEVALDESRATRVSAGGPASVRVDTLPGDRWLTGKVIELSRIDPAAHTFLAKIELPADPALRSGLFGRVRIAGPPRQALAMPAAALVRRGQLTFVFTVADNVARLQPVVAGQVADDRVEILAGLVAGDRVIVRPNASLRDGARIKPATAVARNSAEAGR